MPAGRVSRCWDCYWAGVYRNRCRLNKSVIQSSSIRANFDDYSQWLINKLGPQRAALQINKDFIIFDDIDRLWAQIPDYQTLLHKFNPEGLRRYSRVLCWMNEVDVVQIDEALKTETSEALQIERLMSNVIGETDGAISIQKYCKYLESKRANNEIATRTMRQALSVAIRLTKGLKSDFHEAPDQAMLDGFLLDSPGQKANITGFCNFLNSEFGTRLLPTVDQIAVKKTRKIKLEKKLINLTMQHFDTPNLGFQWEVTALQFYHDLSLKSATSVVQTSLKLRCSKGNEYTHEGRQYFIPHQPRYCQPDQSEVDGRKSKIP